MYFGAGEKVISVFEISTITLLADLQFGLVDVSKILNSHLK